MLSLHTNQAQEEDKRTRKVPIGKRAGFYSHGDVFLPVEGAYRPHQGTEVFPTPHLSFWETLT